MAIAVLLTSAPASLAQTVWYVDDTANGNDDGASWTDAFTDLQDALDAALGQFRHEIWVAEGTYVPGSTRNSTFLIDYTQHPGIRICGGFDGTETSKADRAGLFDQTILSGDVNGDSVAGVAGTLDDDVYHVVSWTEEADDIVLDGFTIEWGNADDPIGSGGTYGGGLLTFASQTPLGTVGVELRNLTFQDCSADDFGGGAYIAGFAEFVMSNCVFRRNRVTGFGSESNPSGGGARFFQCGANTMVGDFIVVNTLFDSNEAPVGGGMSWFHSNGLLVFMNSKWIDNFATAGGAIYGSADEDNPSPGIRIVNSTIAYNTARADAGAPLQGGGGIFLDDPDDRLAQTIIRNSILWGNDASVSSTPPAILEPSVGMTTTTGPASELLADYSDVEVVNPGVPPNPPAPYFGTGSINLPPRFVSPSARDLRLKKSSPCVDAGNDALLVLDYADLDGDGDPIPPGIPSEFTPLDFSLDLREIDGERADTGVDGGNVTFKICDMGCHERQTPQNDPPQ